MSEDVKQQALKTAKYGNFILRVKKADGGGYYPDYVCTSVMLNYEINAIPSARVTLSFGELLGNLGKGGKPQDPSELLKGILSMRKNCNDMLECSILEVFDTSDSTTDKDEDEDTKKKDSRQEIKVFTGVIVTGTPIYKADDKFSSKMISLLCLHSICKLYVSPLASFVIAHNSVIIERMTKTGYKLSAKDAQKDQSLEYKFVVDALVSDVVEEGGTVLENVNKILKAILKASSYRATQKTGSAKSESNDGLGPTDLIKYMNCDTKLSGNVTSNSRKRYYTTIGSMMVALLNNSTIYDTLQQILLTDEFMLNLVPRFTPGVSDGNEQKNTGKNHTEDDIFRITLMPSTMWSNEDAPVAIAANQIISITASFNPIGCLNTPQVLMATFDDPTDPGLSDSESSVRLYGIYSTDSDLQSQLTAARADKKSVGTAASMPDGYFRCTTMRAPSWIDLGPEKQASSFSLKKRADDEDDEDVDDGEGGGDEANATESSETAIADSIAKALFAHKYGRQDTATLKLPASLRFGYDEMCFEANIGNKLNVAIDDTLGFSGIINAINFSYISGIQSSVDYTVTLVCVRDKDDNQNIPCEIYDSIK